MISIKLFKSVPLLFLVTTFFVIIQKSTITFSKEIVNKMQNLEQVGKFQFLLSNQGLSKGNITLMEEAIVVSKLLENPSIKINSETQLIKDDNQKRKTSYLSIWQGEQDKFETLITICPAPKEYTIQSVYYGGFGGEAYAIGLSKEQTAVFIGRQQGIGGWSFDDFCYIYTCAGIGFKNISGQDVPIKSYVKREENSDKYDIDPKMILFKAKELKKDGKIYINVPKGILEIGKYSAFYGLESSIIYDDNKTLSAILIGKDKNFSLYIPVEASVSSSFNVSSRIEKFSENGTILLHESSLQKGIYLSFNSEHYAFFFDIDSGIIKGLLIEDKNTLDLYTFTKALVSATSTDSKIKPGTYDALFNQSTFILIDNNGIPIYANDTFSEH
jgi:hypothetical protein